MCNCSIKSVHFSQDEGSNLHLCIPSAHQKYHQRIHKHLDLKSHVYLQGEASGGIFGSERKHQGSTSRIRLPQNFQEVFTEVRKHSRKRNEPATRCQTIQVFINYHFPPIYPVSIFIRNLYSDNNRNKSCRTLNPSASVLASDLHDVLMNETRPARRKLVVMIVL